MTRLSLIIALLFLLPVILLHSVQGYPINVIDDSAHTITITNSTRIVSLAPSNTEILFAVGAGGRVVGVTEYCDYPPETTNIPKIGGFATVNVEAVINLSPDLIFAAPQNGEETINQLRNLNQTVVVLDPKNIDDIINNILLVGNITGNDDKASQTVENMRFQINKITAITNNLSDDQKPRVLYIVWDEPLYAAGSDTYPDDLIHKAGGINIVKSKGWPVMNLESVIAENPQIIFTSSMGNESYALTNRVLNNTVLAQTDAVKNGRVFPIPDPNIVERAGPRITLGLVELYEYLHTATQTPVLDPTAESTQETPGFGFILAIGILLVIYLKRRV